MAEIPVPVKELLAGAPGHLRRTGRPLVTLCFAQSLDGSLTARPGGPLPLSSMDSLRVTHTLRASHRAILVGIGAVFADDPRLTVRHAAGAHPQPVVLDSRLRFPQRARLLDHPHVPWIMTLRAAPEGEARRLKVVPVPENEQGRLSLPAVLDYLGAQGIESVMVEGGGQVITAFLAGRLADQAVVTVTPYLVGGYRSVQVLLGPETAASPEEHLAQFPAFEELRAVQAGRDIWVWGKLAGR